MDAQPWRDSVPRDSRRAGWLSQVLNQIICQLPTEHPVRDTRPLRELLGHTPIQVAAGGLLGALVALVRSSVAMHAA